MKGVPYRLGGNNYNGIDCSAFVQVAYRDVLNIHLPRTTLAQVSIGNELSYEQVQVGDLAFFKTSRKVRHVGVYIGNKQFMHASTSKGVIISRLDNLLGFEILAFQTGCHAACGELKSVVFGDCGIK